MEVFNSLINSLISVSEPIADHQRKHRPYSLIVDASTGTGDMLCQTD
jgi:hypothetical protein